MGSGSLCHLILENVPAPQARAAEYDFNDANVATGSACWVPLAERFLAA